MRKSLFLTLVLSLCVADFGAFAATSRSARGTTTSATNATQQNAAPVSARAGARQKVASTPGTSSANAPVSARAGARQKVVSAPSTSSSASVSARAATKKAALSMGTKVATATENTVISQECQDAYYGCMDAFCMLDNAAGGRCQCSDRSTELDEVLDEIMRIDEQSDRLASEGVEQIQMGEYANQINARAKSVESGIDQSKKSDAKTGNQRTLDLTSLMNNSLFDVDIEDDGVFGGESSVVDEIANKTGDALQRAAAKVCVARIPAECKSSSSLLQMAYVQKVKSDCVGYENALKQQRTVSQQKLLTAQKAVRDAALDEVRKQNRYETTGECAVAFAQCMQTTAECGADYTGCVTLAAAKNVKNNKSGSIAEQTTIKGMVSGADITIAASTMEALLAKKEICASVTKQCVNSNKNDAVWNLFLRNVAPALKSAELIAEQNLRSSCLPTVAECFKTACKSQFADNDESYDICLSNPGTYKSLCKVQLEPCLEATGGTYENPKASSLWNGLIAMLESMKVDACTKEIKDCLLSEDRCGKDYSGCIGLDTQSIMDLCPVEKLTACVTDGRYATTVDDDGKISLNETNKIEIREYIARIAQGLALNIENNFAKVCQNAAEAALVKACGDGGTNDDESAMCPNLDINLSGLTSKLRVAYKDDTDKQGTKYYDSLDEFISKYGLATAESRPIAARKNIMVKSKDLFVLKPAIVGQTDVYGIKYVPDTTSVQGYFQEYDTDGADEDNGYDTKSKEELLAQINLKYDSLLKQIESDPTVTYCMSGRQIEGFDGNKFGKQALRDENGNPIKDDNGNLEYGEARFQNLLDATKQQLASQILNTVWNGYNSKYNEVNEKLNSEYENLAKHIAGYVEEAQQDLFNEAACAEASGTGLGCIDSFWVNRCGPEYRHIFSPRYDKVTNKCIISRTTYYCPGWTFTKDSANTIRNQCSVEQEHEPQIIQYPSSIAE